MTEYLTQWEWTSSSLLLQDTMKAGSILIKKKKKKLIMQSIGQQVHTEIIKRKPKREIVLGAWGKSTSETDQDEQYMLLPLSDTPVRAKGNISLAQQGFSSVFPSSPGHLGVSNSS